MMARSSHREMRGFKDNVPISDRNLNKSIHWDNRYIVETNVKRSGPDGDLPSGLYCFRTHGPRIRPIEFDPTRSDL
ncbi:hypothetical protein OPQ81_002245 [Rhizoctonia solani]|nr:hypothetical protein OPQ81_002245 [Rhizoctonia solani]